MLLFLLACLSSGFKSESPNYDDGAPSASSDTGSATGSEGTTPPPEQEDDLLALAPASTDAYVFVANPSRDTVTRIAVPSLQVETRAVGDNPVAVATTADYARAITLNVGSDDVSVIEAASFEVHAVPVRENLNRLTLSPDGVWATAGYDPDADQEGQNDGVHSFNEVSFVNLVTRTHVPLAVGYNPRGVQWTPDGTLALVVSDGTLARVDLTADPPGVTAVDIAEDPLDAPPAEEVVLSPDGRYAFVRQFGADSILVVSMEDWTVDERPAGRNPTDMDLSPDGSSVVVVARSSRELYVYDAASPYDDAVRLDLPADSEYGSVVYAGEGAAAVLYTNAAAVPRYGLWDTVAGNIRERTLVKPVSSVGLSPTGGSLIVFHTRDDAADADPESVFADRWALTLVDMEDQRQNPMVLRGEPKGYSVSDNGEYGFFVMEGLPYLEALDFRSLLYEEVPLQSEPVFVGALPGSNIAWASQEHDLGRISFYDAGTGTLDTVTGFELNAEIDHGE